MGHLRGWMDGTVVLVSPGENLLCHVLFRSCPICSLENVMIRDLR
jgi:hypothetical protein